MKRILTCVGTRPNFIKILKLKALFEELGYTYKLLHTGQHFDAKMSDIFFNQLKLGKPDYYLNIQAATNNESVGNIIIETEKVLNEYKPDLIIVPGDVNSTFACAFAAASLDIPIAHIESCLRSHDMTMPEERNRILTDSLSSLLFVTEPVGIENAKKLGIDPRSVHLVGNTIADALLTMLPILENCTVLQDLKISNPYCLVTLHRPVNVDNKSNLKIIIDVLNELSKSIQVIFPIHPRTIKNLKLFDLEQEASKNILFIEPQGYIEFLKLTKEASYIISDSGGIQIESSILGIPCFTLRETTELEITLSQGTNTLLPLQPEIIINSIMQRGQKSRLVDHTLWDGMASDRIVQIIHQYLS